MEEQDKGLPRSSSASAIFPRSSSASSLSPQSPAPPRPRPLQTSSSTTTLAPSPLYEQSGSSPRSPLSLLVPARPLTASPRTSPTSTPERIPFNSLGRQGSSPALLPGRDPRDPPPLPTTRSPSTSHSRLLSEGGSLPSTPSRSPSTSHSKLPGVGGAKGASDAPTTPSRSLASSFSKLPDSYSKLPGVGDSYSKLPDTGASSYSKLPGVDAPATSSYSRLPGTGEVREPSYPRLPGLMGKEGESVAAAPTTSGATAAPSRPAPAPVARQQSQPALTTRRTSSVLPPPSGPPPAAPRLSASASLMRSSSASSFVQSLPSRDGTALPLAVATRSAEGEGEVVAKRDTFKRAQSASHIQSSSGASTLPAALSEKKASTEWKFDPSKWKEVPRSAASFDPLMNPLGGFGESKDEDESVRKISPTPVTSPLPGSSPGKTEGLFEVTSRTSKESPTEAEVWSDERELAKVAKWKQQALISSLVHESNPVVIEKGWSELPDEDKRTVVIDHFMVKTQTTRGLEENDYQTLLRVNRAINGELKKSDPEDRSFSSRYGDMTSSLPKSQGGVWILIRTIEDKLKDPVLANMWQGYVIYGLIDGSQAETLLHSPKTLLFRFSLRHAALCITSKRMHDTQVAFKHDLLNDGFTASEEKKWREYKVVLTTRKTKEMEGIHSWYLSKEQTTERDKQYRTWHDSRYTKF